MTSHSAAAFQDLGNVVGDDKALAIGMIDDRGDIVRVNDAWRGFADGFVFPTTTYTIEEYFLRVCDTVADDSEEGAALIAQGIRSVLKGEREFFNFKYSRHIAAEERWFNGSARRIEHEGAFKVLISHSKVTAGPRKK